MMLSNQTRIADLTVEELVTLIRDALREELYHQQAPGHRRQEALLELEPLQVGDWPEGLKLLSREEFYDNER
jgi:hypothetical protein